MLYGTSWTACSRRVAVTMTSSIRVTCGPDSCDMAACAWSAIAIAAARGVLYPETIDLRTRTLPVAANGHRQLTAAAFER